MALRTISLVTAAAATLVGAGTLTAEPAAAQGWRHGGGYHAGFRGYRGGINRGFYRGGYYRRGWGGRGWGYAGAGVATGLALGALAASTAPYGYGYPAAYGYGYPAYGGCTIQPRRVWGPYGWYVRNVEVCY